MAWWGKLIGGTFGFMLGGPLGAVLGAAFGHSYDRNAAPYEGIGSGDQERVQTAFFTATFAVMGAVAKADGRVSRDEIRLAEAVMTQMHLTDDMRKAAMALFNQGKETDFPLYDIVEQFRRECHRRQTLFQMFLEIQLQAAYADGQFDAAEETLLLDICDRLGISHGHFRQLESLVRINFAHQHKPGSGGYQHTWQQAGQSSPEEAYRVLGIEKTASDAEVKRSYRRLMNQHHPDKLVAKGLPEEMMDMAKEKTQKIRKAYEQIMAQRKT